MILRSGKRKKSVIVKNKADKKTRLELNSSLREHQRFVDSCLGFLESSEESLHGFEMEENAFAGVWGENPPSNRPFDDQANTSRRGNNPSQVPLSNEDIFLRRSLRFSPGNSAPVFPETSSADVGQSTSARTSLNKNAPIFALPRNQCSSNSKRSALDELSLRNSGSQFPQNQTQTNVPQPQLDVPTTFQVNNRNSDNENISRLERMVASLTLSVNTLNERFNSLSTAGISVPPSQPRPASGSRLSTFRNFTNAHPVSSNNQPNYHPFSNGIQTQANLLNQAINVPQYSNNIRNENAYRTPPHKWRVRYTGDNNVVSVEFFLDQLIVLKESNSGITWEDVLAVFPQFLEGEAARWFIRYRKKLLANNQQLSWDILRHEMLTQFRGSESEVSIWCKLVNRRQGERESFDKFFSAILDLHDRIPVPLSDVQIIDILKHNVKLDIQRCLVTYSTTNLADFVNKCRETEILFLHSNFPRRVSEVEAEKNEMAGEIEAFVRRPSAKNSSSVNLKCWNCGNVGHDWKVCEDPLTIFCYWCGLKNFKCKQCPNCNPSQNFRVSGRNHDPPPSAPPQEEH